MLCYRCGSHVADTVETCPTCGQKLATGGVRQATATFSRRRGAGSVVEGAPYKANDLIANRYTVKDVVAAGPLGFVFRVHDKEIDVEVALKVINPKLLQTPEERRTFSKHLKLARKLSHPNLVRVYEDGEDNDRPFFTSQFLDGLSLRKIIDLRLQKGQFFALHEIEPILAQVCQALEGAHKVGPHSDLKPDNVLVLPDLLKVTDFGLGLAVPRLPFVQAMKARKADRYLAPELAEGREVDERIDLYSLGVILGEMLSGLTPDGSVPELARRNPDVSQPLEGFYRKAINQNPLARHKSAADFLGELSDLSKKGASATAKPKVESGASPAPAPARPRPTAGSLQLQPRRETKPPPPVPDLPPPPPPQSEENPLPDETQRVDSLQLEEVLARSTNGSSNGHRDPLPMGPPSVEVADPIRDSTEVVDSGQFVAGADDNAETKASVDAVPGDSIQDASPVGRSRTWLLVAALIVVGVTMGAALGYFLVQRQKAGGPDDRNPPVAKVDDKAALDKGAANVEEVEGVNVRPTPRDSEEVPVEKVAALKAEADKAASERAAADKAEADKAEADKAAAAEKAAADKEAADRAAADKAAAEKAVADKAAAEKAAADKAVADRAAADKAAERAAEKAAADKAAQEKLAADRAAAAKAAQEKAAAAKAAQDKAAQERAAKLAADKAAADKAAADKAAADKVAADKAAADKAAQDKAAKEKVATADKGATQDSAAAAGKPLPAAPGEPCPAGMRLVAKGEFKMGTARNDPMMGFDEKALVSVEVKGFCIDAFEYPNKKGTAPSVSISWADAKRSCEGQGKRLCSEAEWEKSCKGPGGARWPFGNGWDVAACNTEDESGEARAIVPAGRFAKCRSGYGVADLSGNVAEWTEDKVVKGGSFASADYAVRCSARRAGAQMSKSSEVGFRCCSDPP